MPQYKNNTTSVLFAGSLRIEPGETVSTYEYLRTLPTGITQEAATPYFSNVISSAKLTNTTTVTVPTTYTDSNGKTVDLVGNYKIKVYVGTGECTVKSNSSSATARYVGLYETYDLVCLTRIIDNIIVTISSGTVYVTIEQI